MALVISITRIILGSFFKVIPSTEDLSVDVSSIDDASLSSFALMCLLEKVQNL